MTIDDELRSERLRQNAAVIREKVAAAALRSGRAADAVTVVAVSKYSDLQETRALFDAGFPDLGESRPQKLREKADLLQALPIRWHLIGPLQRNKIRKILGVVELVHSGDRLELLQDLDAEAKALDQPLRVLLQVNCSGESQKGGFEPEDLASVLPRIAELTHLRVEGLMTMAGLEGGVDRARQDFAKLRELRDSLLPDEPPGLSMAELSMGMSGDYEAAIEEGATIVRIGSAFFEGIDENA
jgi:pyridoxal phosphate enzyme (YggS family)